MRFERSAPVKPGVPGGERVEIDVARDRLAARVDLEDLAAAEAVRAVDHDLAVEATWPEQRRIEDVGAVRGGDQDDVVLHLEAVHLDEELVQRLLALVVAAAETRAAVSTDGVDLVHEDDAGGGLLRLLEEVAHARGADADEHLDEVGARDGEERHAGLAGDRAREQRLARSRRPVQQHALGDARAERLELLRVLEELLDLVELLDRLVSAGDVLERDLRRVRRHALRTALPEAHHLRAAALHLVHEEDPEPDQDHERQDVDEQRPPRRRARALGVELDVVRLEQVLELRRRLRGRVVDLDLAALDEIRRDLLPVRVELGVVDGAFLDLRDQLRVRDLLLRGAARQQRLARQIDEQHDDDEREKCAAEEAVHVGRRRVALSFFGTQGANPASPVTCRIAGLRAFGT